MTSVKFSGGGDQVIASYSGDNIYSFDCVDHARESEGYCTAQGWSRQVHDFQHGNTCHLHMHSHALGLHCIFMASLCMTAFISYSKFAMYAALLSQDNIAIVSQKPFLWHASFWFPYIFDTVMF